MCMLVCFCAQIKTCISKFNWCIFKCITNETKIKTINILLECSVGGCVSVLDKCTPDLKYNKKCNCI